MNVTAMNPAAKPAKDERRAREAFQINDVTELHESGFDAAILKIGYIHALASFMQAAHLDAAELGERGHIYGLNNCIKAGALSAIVQLASQAQFDLIEGTKK